MILEDYVKISVQAAHRRHYQNLGYNLDVTSYVINGIAYYTFIANVKDLPPTSTVNVTRICDECGKIDSVQYVDRGSSGRCFKCTRSKKTGNNYARCTECGKSLYHYSSVPMKCEKCFGESIKIENKYPDIQSRQHMLIKSRSTHRTDIVNWSKFVRDRDNYTCQICGRKDGKMDAHHLFDKIKYPHLVLDLSNGICICKSCHTQLHNYNQNLEPVTPIEFIKLLKRYQNEYN